MAIWERRKKLIEMRRAGKTFAECADMLGYHDASHASRDFHKTLKSLPAADVDDLRRERADRLEFLYEKQMETVLDPPCMHSAIGRLIEIPGRPGEYVRNESVRNTAIANCVRIEKEYSALMGIPIGQAEPNPELQMAMAYVGTERAALKGELSAAQAELAALRARLAAYESPRLAIAP